MRGSDKPWGIRSLSVFFVAWKALLLVIACASPGPGYDTSTQVLFDQYQSASESKIGKAIEHAVLRLTRWDGIYFAALAERGHVNEQDWAFSWVLARITDAKADMLLSPLAVSPIVKRALSGIIISNLSHLLAVIVLYELTARLCPTSASSRHRIAFVAACLHIASPAGLFLSAPYGESAFALFNFTGMLCYVLAVQRRFSPHSSLLAYEAIYLLLSGVCFAFASAIRSNGLLSGILFAWEASEAISKPREFLQDIRNLSRFLVIAIAGLMVALGFAFPQLIAYMAYCLEGQTRPWCKRTPPSIYGWVQDHYWGVGFLRYWTLSNLPLFLIAGPVLGLLLMTGYICVWRPELLVSNIMLENGAKSRQEAIGIETVKSTTSYILRRLALPQLALALTAATSFHVQIINRISSGYPLWYVFLAMAICSRSHRQPKQPTISKASISGSGLYQIGEDGATIPKASLVLMQGSSAELAVRAMVMYAIIQGGLYASFLPPA